MPHVPHPATFITLFFLLFVTGCYATPVRHLASDAALLKIGSSSRNDVLTYLGEPDRQQPLPGGGEEWIYSEEVTSDLQKLPLVGSLAKEKGEQKLVVVLRDDVVQSCQFREFGRKEFDWADDYSWQEQGE